ncbi:MAG TPA: response regulator transcription factor [Candidatus Competibacter sp.]|nr:DNA-binding response regulator [Candidatus Competibacteraceae bacterium]HRE55281.1 response regulator transcription factor [Candidatus Competibacter sp.]HUM95398.1 response regulator transcription factor [Candidatus Competibacter sp.]
MSVTQSDANHSVLRLLIVDDQPLIRRGLAMMLATEADIEVVGQAADGLEAIEKALATRPDIVVMDLQMPRASGIVATREITAKLPATRVVVLTTFDHDDLVFEAICAGAQAYLLKDASEADVLETLRAVRRGESRLSPTVARKVMDQFRAFAGSPAKAKPASSALEQIATENSASVVSVPPSSPLAAAPAAKPSDSLSDVDPLTEKEERILDLLAESKSNKQIAAEIFLAEGTVKNYVSRIMDKLHARNRLELAMHAAKRRG